MKLKSLLSLGLVLLFLNACEKETKQEKQKKTPAIELSELTQAEVTVVIDKWVNLWATYDLDQLENIFLQSESLTYFSSEKEGLIKGYKQLYPHHTGFGFVEGGKQPAITLWLEDIETRVNGETAMVAATWYNTDYGAAKETAQNGPVTFVLVRDKQGDVKISHAHFANN